MEAGVLLGPKWRRTNYFSFFSVAVAYRQGVGAHPPYVIRLLVVLAVLLLLRSLLVRMNRHFAGRPLPMDFSVAVAYRQQVGAQPPRVIRLLVVRAVLVLLGSGAYLPQVALLLAVVAAPRLDVDVVTVRPNLRGDLGG